MRDLKLDGGRIRARVQGSRPQPYKVEIGVPAVADADAERLAQRLATDPALVARLLNRELDPAVLEHARALKLPIFPKRWSDLDMSCSCPDWAVPCKHLAAAIYLLSREIDGDPFLVFRLRGVELPALLARQGVDLGAAQAAEALPPDAPALFEAETAAAEVLHDPAALLRLDFTRLPDLREPLWRLLQEKPVFWRGGDFRELALKTVTRVAREARRQLDSAPAGDDAAALPLPEGRPQLTIDAQGTIAVAGTVLTGRPLETLASLAGALTAVPPARLQDLHPDLATLHTLHLLALHLLAQGAVVPRLFGAARAPGLRWCAAELDPTVRGMVEQAAVGLPPGLVLRRAGRSAATLGAGVQARGCCRPSSTCTCGCWPAKATRTWCAPSSSAAAARASTAPARAR